MSSVVVLMKFIQVEFEFLVETNKTIFKKFEL